MIQINYGIFTTNYEFGIEFIKNITKNCKEKGLPYYGTSDFQKSKDFRDYEIRIVYKDILYEFRVISPTQELNPKFKCVESYIDLDTIPIYSLKNLLTYCEKSKYNVGISQSDGLIIEGIDYIVPYILSAPFPNGFVTEIPENF